MQMSIINLEQSLEAICETMVVISEGKKRIYVPGFSLVIHVPQIFLKKYMLIKIIKINIFLIILLFF